MIKMIFKNIFSYRIRIFIFSICINIATNLYSQEIRVDFLKAYGGSFSEYFNQVNYIPLETTKESLFGNISKMIVTDSSFVIYDDDTRSVLFFSKKGKFLNKVTDKRNYPNILYNSKKQIIKIEFTDDVKNVAWNKYYSLSGKLIKEEKPIPKSKLISEIFIGVEGYYTVSNNCLIRDLSLARKDSTYYAISIYKNDSLRKNLLPWSTKNSLSYLWLSGYIKFPQESNNSESIYVSTPLDYAVYKVNRDTAIKIFNFIFPANRSIGKKIISCNDPDSLQIYERKILRSQDVIRSVGNILFNKNLLFFKINPSVIMYMEGSESVYNYNYILDTISKKLIAIERISPDDKTYFLPFFDQDFRSNGFRFYNDELYTTISSLKLFNAEEKNKSQSLNYPPVLQQYFKTQNRKSNPVIVKMKLKDF